jgi:hypothetical protein
MSNHALEEIIQAYLNSRKGEPDAWVMHCRNQPTLRAAIQVAARAVNHAGKRHPHQYRLKDTDLKTFADLLGEREAELSGANDFHALFTMIDGLPCPGVGPLTRYDTAHRIGERLALNPEKVYLHAGTRRGAEALLDRKIKETTLTKADLPAAFGALEYWEIEDILCLGKDCFAGGLTSDEALPLCDDPKPGRKPQVGSILCG